jgi:sacsin
MASADCFSVIDSSSDEGESYGQKPPPLTAFLANILNKYPEGSQLKELVQNADDAGASQVKFLLDFRCHGMDTLLESSLAPHQVVMYF